MMAIDQKQIETAIVSAPTEEQCRAIDKVLAERRREAIIRARAAIRVSDDSPWLVLQVMTGREKTVGDAFINAGIEALIPMKMGPALRRQRREIPPKPQPIMVGYILTRCMISNDCLAALLGFEHVVSILGGYEKPFLVDAENVRILNEKAGKGEFDHERPQSLFAGVKRVRIKHGAFAGFVGEFQSGGGKGKGVAVVEVDFMGQARPMIMPLAFLEPL